MPDADRRARDRRLDDVERRRWRAMRREIEAVAADPDRVAGAAMAARLAAHAAQLDEPEPGTEVTRADLLELDLRATRVPGHFVGDPTVDPRVDRKRGSAGLDHRADVVAQGAHLGRNVFASTIIAYTGRPSLLAERVPRRGRARPGGRSGRGRPGRHRCRACVLIELRNGMHAGVRALTRALAEGPCRTPTAVRALAQLDDVERRSRSAMRRELEAVAADPDRIAGAASGPARRAAGAARRAGAGTEVRARRPARARWTGVWRARAAGRGSGRRCPACRAETSAPPG
ncbi:MAG: hypothetical protein E6J90_03860 [Deltaproteobacteria bacterium]|nr:MAG: hypothetical protein E6J90_03860 [Deltaproteobacteria bacterium]